MEKITYEQFKEAFQVVRDYHKQVSEPYKEAQKALKSIHRFGDVTKETLIRDVCSVRVRNILCCCRSLNPYGFEIKVGDLSKLSEEELSRVRNFGTRMMAEIKQLCFYAGVQLLP